MLPIGVTTKNASLNCYSGAVSQSTPASARKLACNMKAMFAMIENRKQQIESQKEDKRAMAEMVMPDGAITPIFYRHTTLRPLFPAK